MTHLNDKLNLMLYGSQSPRRGAFSGCGWRICPPGTEGSREQPIMGGPSVSGLGEELTTRRREKKKTCYEMLHGLSELAGSCEYGNEPSCFIKGGEFND
jgi:hypothetical protein